MIRSQRIAIDLENRTLPFERVLDFYGDFGICKPLKGISVRIQISWHHVVVRNTFAFVGSHINKPKTAMSCCGIAKSWGSRPDHQRSYRRLRWVWNRPAGFKFWKRCRTSGDHFSRESPQKRIWNSKTSSVPTESIWLCRRKSLPLDSKPISRQWEQPIPVLLFGITLFLWTICILFAGRRRSISGKLGCDWTWCSFEGRGLFVSRIGGKTLRERRFAGEDHCGCQFRFLSGLPSWSTHLSLPVFGSVIEYILIGAPEKGYKRLALFIQDKSRLCKCDLGEELARVLFHSSCSLNKISACRRFHLSRSSPLILD